MTRSQENRIRAVITRVHEHHLAESLAPVEEAIRKWRAGEGSIFAIDDAIHQHQMRSPHFWRLYANAAVSSPETRYILDEAEKFGLITPEQHRELTQIWGHPKIGRR